ncbi:MAG: class IV adenylate cyclase [Pyrinomonadaceae bacterium]
MPIEIEKKYRLTPERHDEIADSLQELGAEFAGSEIEENILFTNDDLFQNRSFVRIRKTARRSLITFKQRKETVSNAKHQVEHETEVKDAETARTIFESIGLRAVLVYEKRRKTYKFRGTEVVLDELPFGLFVEIEGPLTAIAEAEMFLGLEELEIEPETYPRLTAKLGKKNGDIIEARFASH